MHSTDQNPLITKYTDSKGGENGETLVYGSDKVYDLSQNDFFQEVLCIVGYTSDDDILLKLNKKKYKMGLNIICTDTDFAINIIENTKFARYTINRNHVKIDPSEGWGGMWPMDHWYSDYGNLLMGVTSYVDDGGDAIIVTIDNECISYAKEPRNFIRQLENKNVSSLAILPKNSNKDKIVERIRAVMLPNLTITA